MNNGIIELKQKQQYFANKKVFIIKVYEPVHLVKIRFENTDIYTVVDISTLSNTPDYTNAISLGMLEEN